MSFKAALVLFALVSAYGVFAIPVMFRFRTYCKQLAIASDRLAELNDRRGIDDGGNNPFEREQWWNLLRGDFQGLKNPVLFAEAAVLSKKIRLSMLFAVGLVVVFPFLAIIQ